MLQVKDLPEPLASVQQLTHISPSGAALKEVLREPEKKVIIEALEQVGWNRKKAADLLNINRTTLYNKMKKHNLL